MNTNAAGQDSCLNKNVYTLEEYFDYSFIFFYPVDQKYEHSKDDGACIPIDQIEEEMKNIFGLVDDDNYHDCSTDIDNISFRSSSYEALNEVNNKLFIRNFLLGEWEIKIKNLKKEKIKMINPKME